MSEPAEGLFGPAQSITSVRPDSKDPTLVHVMVGGNRRYKAPATDAASLGLAVGAAWTPALAAACEHAMEVRRAMRRAAALLADKPRTRADVSDRLTAAGFAADVVADAVARLERKGLIDDRRLAADRAAKIAEGAPLGEAAIRERLERGGLEPAAAEEALRSLGGDAAARAYGAAVEIEAGLERTIPAHKRWRRLLATLARRGFDEDTAMDAARRVLGEPPAGEPD
jgi:regulatory protein